jgi:hypothetical protein
MWICDKCGHKCILKQEDTTPNPIRCPAMLDKEPNWRPYHIESLEKTIKEIKKIKEENHSK